MSEDRGLLRIANADVDGNDAVYIGLTRIRGVSHMVAAAICTLLKLDKHKKAGALSDAEVKSIEALLKSPEKFPAWLLNRRHEYESGESKHLVSTDLAFNTENDIKMMKKMKSYKGVRHSQGLPVRGQSTKAHFRHGTAVGVTKKAKAGKKS
ncbi:MAG: 30S ribosomal protein S13 [Nanoarchaeota archaeon]|nr:30S ribosomal protein S13 [Nanoarchaeota archaeon]